MKNFQTKTINIDFSIYNVILLIVILAVSLFALNIAQVKAQTEMRAEGSIEVRNEDFAQMRGEAQADIELREDEAVFCTADAFQCPSGEWVGRTGPNCEFVCPGDEDGPVDNDGEGNRDNGGSRVVPSQPRVITTPVSDPDDDGDSFPTTLEGITVRSRDLDSDSDTIGDIDELEVSGESRVSVNGDVVRSWDPETKDAVRARLETSINRNDANDFGLRVAMQAVENEEIKTIEVGENTARITFETELKVLGFIKANVTAEVVADSNGEVRTSYPWWSFLARKSQKTNASLFANIAVDLATRVSN